MDSFEDDTFYPINCDADLDDFFNLPDPDSKTFEHKVNPLRKGIVNDGLLVKSFELYPPRDFLLKENHPTPPSRSRCSSRNSHSSSGLSSPEARSRSSSISPIRTSHQNTRPSDIINAAELNHALAQVAIETSQPKKMPTSSSPSRGTVAGKTGPVRRGTLLGPYMFMVKSADKKLLERYNNEDLKTMLKQLYLLKLQIKDKQDRDRERLENQILTSWQVVHELEENARQKEMEEEAAKDLEYTHNQLNHMMGVIEQVNNDIVPVFEKLTMYHKLKQGLIEKDKFMKSVKSFNLRTKTNQEYAEKALHLDAAVKRLERMNEKRERMLRLPIIAQVHRINLSALNTPLQSPISRSPKKRGNFFPIEEEGEKVVKEERGGEMGEKPAPSTSHTPPRTPSRERTREGGGASTPEGGSTGGSGGRTLKKKSSFSSLMGFLGLGKEKEGEKEKEKDKEREEGKKERRGLFRIGSRSSLRDDARGEGKGESKGEESLERGGIAEEGKGGEERGEGQVEAKGEEGGVEGETEGVEESERDVVLLLPPKRREKKEERREEEGVSLSLSLPVVVKEVENGAAVEGKKEERRGERREESLPPVKVEERDEEGYVEERKGEKSAELSLSLPNEQEGEKEKKEESVPTLSSPSFPPALFPIPVPPVVGEKTLSPPAATEEEREKKAKEEGVEEREKIKEEGEEEREELRSSLDELDELAGEMEEIEERRERESLHSLPISRPTSRPTSRPAPALSLPVLSPSRQSRGADSPLLMDLIGGREGGEKGGETVLGEKRERLEREQRESVEEAEGETGGKMDPELSYSDDPAHRNNPPEIGAEGEEVGLAGGELEGMEGIGEIGGMGEIEEEEEYTHHMISLAHHHILPSMRMRSQSHVSSVAEEEGEEEPAGGEGEEERGEEGGQGGKGEAGAGVGVEIGGIIGGEYRGIAMREEEEGEGEEYGEVEDGEEKEEEYSAHSHNPYPPSLLHGRLPLDPIPEESGASDTSPPSSLYPLPTPPVPSTPSAHLPHPHHPPHPPLSSSSTHCYESVDISLLDTPDHLSLSSDQSRERRDSIDSTPSLSSTTPHKKRRPSLKGLFKHTSSLFGGKGKKEDKEESAHGSNNAEESVDGERGGEGGEGGSVSSTTSPLKKKKSVVGKLLRSPSKLFKKKSEKHLDGESAHSNNSQSEGLPQPAPAPALAPAPAPPAKQKSTSFFSKMF